VKKGVHGTIQGRGWGEIEGRRQAGVVPAVVVAVVQGAGIDTQQRTEGMQEVAGVEGKEERA
jgi:hypothetical protein